MHPSQPSNLLLEGVVGSTAYGLATPESDIDTLGVFACPTEALVGLDRPAETLTAHDPDGCWHEAAKFARLALSVNPTVYELLWLDEGGYTTVTNLGLYLVTIRDAFLSADRVRDSYLGYATSQFKRLTERGDGTFGSDTRSRAAKHARHMARLVRQGHELYTTGRLTVSVGDDADWFHEFSAAGPDRWVSWFERERGVFADARSVLPEFPDRERVDGWLAAVRYENLGMKPAHAYMHLERSSFGDAPYCARCHSDWPCETEQKRVEIVRRMLGDPAA